LNLRFAHSFRRLAGDVEDRISRAVAKLVESTNQ